MSKSQQVEVPQECIGQIQDAYGQMAQKARYRPAAPSDGFGNITVPPDELRLNEEAQQYAGRWWTEEESCDFSLGCCDYETRKATIFAVEAARNLCAGIIGDDIALRLLKMAVKELEQVLKTPERQANHRLIFGGERTR